LAVVAVTATGVGGETVVVLAAASVAAEGIRAAGAVIVAAARVEVRTVAAICVELVVENASRSSKFASQYGTRKSARWPRTFLAKSSRLP
jgi:hypothetical protein